MKPKPVQCILAALKYESEPIIDHYGLKRVETFDFPVFRSGAMLLVGIGVGKKYVKTRIFEIYAKKKSDEKFYFINIGIAGGNPRNTVLGECYMIDKIYDDCDKVYYYPDIQLDSNLQLRKVSTVEEPIIHGGSMFPELVDMEASEIFQVCQELDPEHRPAFIKIVSDHMDLKKLEFERNRIYTLIKNNMDNIDSFLRSYHYEKS